MRKLIIIDNYDSFTYNLVQAFQALKVDVHVYKNNEVDLQSLKNDKPTHLVLGPGPGKPQNAGITLEALRHFSDKIPILGVCLGHQAIGIHFGATLTSGFNLQHGKKDQIWHSQKRLFATLPTPIQVGRYHSLMITDIPTSFYIDAKSDDGTIMAVAHKKHPIFGVQFHPESILSPMGMLLLERFVENK
jgi:anthranilate synthase/aminodeoxychorismate synthase-like glutamine amidotransferase